MKKIILTMCVIFFLVIYRTGLSQYNQLNLDDYIFETKETQLAVVEIKKPCFIYENDVVNIRFDLKDIKRKIITEITTSNHLLGSKLEGKITSLNLDEYRLSDFDPPFKGSLECILADLIEEGNIFLVNKKRNEITNKIIVEYYDYNPEPLWGNKGRIYKFLSGETFYQNIDKSY
jgi:hypothetical protein